MTDNAGLLADVRLTRDEKKAQTRQRLLDAAWAVFTERGFLAPTLDDIAEAAGLTKGAVYSNFDSKEELFLALLAGDRERSYAPQEDLAPSDLSHAKGPDPLARARAWGEHLGGLQPNRRNVALFLEMNAFALRNERTRAGVAEHNRQFFTELGTGLRELLDAPEADPLQLGIIAQSLYVGLMMHGAFTGEVDEQLFATAYESLASAARATAART